MFNHQDEKKEIVLYGGIALGVLLGATLATYLWKRRANGIAELSTSPLERAEQLIESCETKLESIEQAISDLRSSR